MWVAKLMQFIIPRREIGESDCATLEYAMSSSYAILLDQ